MARPLVLVLCGFLLLAATAPQASAADSPRSNAGVPASVPDSLAWREVLSGIERDLDRRAAEVEDVRRGMPGLLEEARAYLARMDNHLSQVLIIGGVAGRTPWAMRSLRAHYQSMEIALEREAGMLRLTRDHLERIKQENATLREIRRKGPENAYNDATVAALEEPTRKMAAIKSDVDELKTRIDAVLQLFDELGENVREANSDFLDDYIDVFKAHFFHASRPPLEAYGLKLLESRAGEWAGDFPRFIGPVLAWTRWGDLAVVGLPAWLAVLFAGSWLVRRLRSPGAGDLVACETDPTKAAAPSSELSQPGEPAASVNVGGTATATEPERTAGWAMLSFGVVLFVVSWFVPFTANHVLNLALVIVAAAGGTLLVRRLLEPGLLVFFLALYTTGTILDILGTPAEVLCVVWPPVMAWAAWSRWRDGCRRSAWVFGLLGAVSLMGFGPQAVVLVQAWFLLHLARGVARAMRASMTGRGAAWLRYVYPLAVTILSVAYLAWLLMFMGGPGFVDYVFTLELALGPARLSLDAIAAMAVLFFAARLGLVWLGVSLERASYGGRKLDPALSHTLSTLASYAVWLSYLLAALHILGVPLTGLTWIASGLSVGVGFGLKDIISNFMSGLIILFGGSIKKGDVVQTGKTLGEVTNVSVRNTTVRTLDNSMVIIPNSSFLKGEIINWSYQDKRIRLTIPVSVAPGTKVKKVRKILQGVAADHERVLKDPAPSVFMRQFGRMGLDFELYVWIEDFRDKFRVESDLAAAIDQQLQENKITVAFQGVKVKYKPRGTEEAQREAAREALREKRRSVFALVRPLRQVHLRAKWGVPVKITPPAE
ncbi:MAG: mechanosensitive ion channel domain-containing protein [Acidobacteriota bacterium]